MTRASRNRFRGFQCAVLCGLLVVCGLAYFPNNDKIALLVVVVLPFLVAFAITRNAIYSIIIVWLNELIFGVSGVWFQLGPVPGRGVLLLIVLAVVFINSKTMRVFSELPKAMHIILFFYGVAYPVILVIWGVIFKGAQFSNALADVLRFVGLLGVYPVYLFIRTNYVFGKQWLLVSVTLLSSVFIMGSIGPEDIKLLLIDNWIYLGRATPDVKINYLRMSYEPMIFGYIGIFYGLSLMAANRRTSKTIGASAIILNLAPTVVNFLRGPLGAIYISIMWFVLGKLRNRGSFLKIVKVLVVFVCAFLISIGLILNNPVAQNKIDQLRFADRLVDYVSSTRVDQSKIMIDAWKQAPIFGVGVGIPLVGYKSSGLSVEVQYLMILYRTGIVGLLIIVIPLLLLAKNLAMRSRIRRKSNIYDDIDDFEKCVGHTILALAIASFFNPYLASSVTVTLLVFYYALRNLKTKAM